METEKTLETERALLTLLTEEDLPAMMEMAREADTFKYLKKLRIMTEPEYAAFLRGKLEQIRDKRGFHWAVWLKDVSGEAGPVDAAGEAPRTFIGAVNLNPVAGTPMMQVGCQLKKDYWHQGFASELTRRIRDFGMKEAGLKTVYGLFEKENQASRRLLEKLGFGWQETRDEQGIILEIHKYPAP
ncbi:MAG TPA: GNAT family N-acetyltransferase [Puia sp.]|nr:GNAT family N-acetyltransferase [Puia sp.]